MNNNKYKVLVIEDEKNINQLICALMDANGYQPLSAFSCGEGLIIFSSHLPDLVILDLGLPDMDGCEFIKQIRTHTSSPIIVLSARADESDKVNALNLGANDYVTKPFGSQELIARVRCALRTSRHSADTGRFPNGKFTLEGLIIDYDSRQVFLHETEIRLTQTEYNIIALLSEHCGKVLTYSFIIRSIWGYNDIGSIKKLQVNMVNIRKKFGAKPGKKSYIVNELGVGYRMSEP